MSLSDSGFNMRHHLAYDYVRVNSFIDPSWIEFQVKLLKCDQCPKRVKLVVGATGWNMCPVAAMPGYLVQRLGKSLVLIQRWPSADE